MTIKNHHIIEKVIAIHQLEFGEFYFFDDFVVSEIYDEVLFNWEKAKIVIDIAENIYGKGCQPHYISNRIHHYAIVPNDWLTFFKKRYLIKSYIIVTDAKNSIMNLHFERLFFKKIRIEKVTNLDEALQLV